MSTPAFPIVTSPVSGVAGFVVPSAQFPVVTSPESTLPIVQVPIVNQSAYDLGLGSGNPHAVDRARYADSAPYSGLINPPAFGSAAFHDVASNGNATTSQVVLGSDTRLQGTGVGGNYLAANDPSVTNARVPLSHAASHGQSGTDPLTLTKAQISDFPAVVASDWNTLANKPAAFPPDGTAELVARKGQPSGYAGLGVDGKVPGSQLPAASGGTITWTDVANKPSNFPPDGTAELVARKGQASGYAGLGTDGKVPSGQLPPIASDWNTLANKPTTFSPALHAASHGNGAADAVTIVKAQVSDFPSLGTASSRDVPASGDAGNTQAVLGADSRLAQVATNTAGISTNSSAITAIQGDSRWTNARAPTAHASTHVGGSDAIAQASSVLVGLCPMVDNVTIQVVASKLTAVALAWTSVTGKPTTFAPIAHAASHGNGQADAVTIVKAQVSDFPTLGTASPLDVASSGNATSGQVVKGNDGRLSDSRTPSAHAPTHRAGGSDALRLDELAAPTDVTTLNVTTSAHGLVPKATGTVTQFLDGTGGWSTPAGTGGAGDMTASTYAAGTGSANTHTVDHALYANVAPYSGITGTPTLGTAAAKDIPSSGDATDTQVVLGSDSRLAQVATNTAAVSTNSATLSLISSDSRWTDARTPVAHQASHVGGTDAIPVATSLITGLCPVLDNATIVVTASKLAVGAVPNASITGLGNAALLTAPGTGVNATSGQLVKGDDTRLANARTPAAHAATHASGGGDAVTLVKAQISDFPTLGTSAAKNIPASGNAAVGEVVYGTDTRLNDSRTPAAHAASHGNGAGDAITIANTQVTGLGNASTLTAPSAAVNATTGQVVKGDDTRLSDSRTPLGHAASHKAAGGDAIKLDELAAPTDVTTLNASASAHGLLPKLSNVATQFLNGVGAYATPAGAGDMAKVTYDTANRGYVDRAVLADSASAVAYANVTGAPTLGTSAAKNIPTSGNAAVGEVVYGTDTRLTDARTAVAHAASHIPGGGDVIASASATVGGLVPTPPNNTNKWYLGNSSWAYQAQSTETNGTFTVPTAGSTVTVAIQSSAWPVVGQTLLITDGTRIGFFEITTVSSATSLIVANRGYLGNSTSGTMATGSTVRLMGPGLATATQPGFVPIPPNDATKVLTGAMTYVAVAYANVTGTPTLGTAAALDVPSSGDATDPQVVLGADSRLAKVATNTAAIASNLSTISAISADVRWTDARTPLAHETSHITGGADIIPSPTTTTTGLVPLLPSSLAASKYLSGSATFTQVDYTQLLSVPSTFAPAGHSTSHKTGGSDSIALDTLAVPTDITTLNATSSAHGLMPKGTASTTTFYRSDLTQAVPVLDALGAPTDITTLNASTTAHGLLAKLSNVATQYMDGTGAWSVPSSAVTTTSQSFTCPAAGATVSVTFTSTTGFAAGMGLYISGAGLFNVSSVTDATHAVVLNLGVTGNAVSGTIATAKNVWLAGVATVATATLPGYVPTPSNTVTQFLNGQMGYTAPVLDLLGAPTDVTTLNASTSAHGLLKKLSNVATQYMDGTGAWSVPAGSGSAPPKPFKTWIVGLEGSPTSTLNATFGVQNNRPHLAFNDAATWTTLLFGVVPTGASLGSGFIIRYSWKSIVTTPSGNARWSAALERMNTAQNSDSLDTPSLLTTAVGAQHVLVETAITITTIDSMVAGDKFMLQVQRIGGDVLDTLSGDACLQTVTIETVL